MTERGIHRVSKNSWHGRAWLNWSKNAAFKTPKKHYVENFCHYWRVVLIWRPSHWFFYTGLHKNPTNDGLTTPFTMLIVLAVLGWLGDLVYRHPLKALLSAGLMVGIVAGMLGLVWLMVSAKEHYDNRGKGAPEQPEDSTFRCMAWEWIKGKKHRICPLIVVETDTDQE